MKFKLFPYQETGVEKLLHSQRFLLADEMGLGKTVQVLSAIEKDTSLEVKNALIICPANLCLMWESRIKEWFSPDVCEVLQLKNVKDSVKLSKSIRFIIVSYNYIQQAPNVLRLLKLKWRYIVADEFHSCKNPGTKTYKGFKKLCRAHSGYIWMLTGTPATNNGQDYYTVLDTISPASFGSFSDFSDKFCNTRLNWFSRRKEYFGVRESSKEELRKVFSDLCLRRLKKNVLKDLPPKLTEIIPVEVDAETIAESLDISVATISHCLLSGKVPPAHIMSLLKAIGLAKVEFAVEYIKNVTEPLVVFCSHIEVLGLIKDNLKGLRVGVISGAESREQKDKAVTDFQTGKIDIILCNIKSGGVGITLTASSHVLFVEQNFSPALMNQASDRSHRIGQTASCVNIVHLIASGTMDEKIRSILKEKETFMKYTLGDT